jgi:WD40 repeat protein
MKAYVADSNQGKQSGFVHVLDLESGERLGTLETLYDPDLAISPDGERLYVGETDLGQTPARHYLSVYDASSLRLLHREPFENRTLYNVAPVESGLVVSPDGQRVYVSQTEILGDDEARYYVGAFSAEGRALREEITVPHAITTFGVLDGQSLLYFALSGRRGDAVALADPGPGHELRALSSTRDTVHGEQPFAAIASVADDDGKLVYLVDQSEQLRIWRVESNEISEPVRLSIPEGLSIPLQHILVAGSRLYLGLGSTEKRAQGKSELLYVFWVDGGVFREVAYCIWPPAEKIALSPDRRRILSLSREKRSLSLLDTDTGELVRRIEDIGVSPVAMTIAH